MSRETIRPDVFLNSVRSFGDRATFFAGFTYYQIISYPTAAGNDMTYIACITLSFVFSVLSASISVIYSHFLEGFNGESEKQEFISKSLVFPRGVFRLYILSSITYLLGLSRIGWAYYPESTSKWIPFCVMVLSTLLIFRGIWYVVSSQLLFQTNFGAGKEDWLIDHEEVVASSTIAVDQRSGGTFEELVENQCGVIAERSIFIAGLLQTAMMYYVPTENSASYVFLMLVSVSTASSFLAGFILATIQVFLPDTEPEKRLAFAIYLIPFLKVCSFGYVMSFIGIGFSLALVKYGDSFTPQFASVGVGTGVGIVGAIFTCWVGSMLLGKGGHLKSVDDISGGTCKDGSATMAPLSLATSSSSEDSAALQLRFTRNLKCLNVVGTLATISPGYIYQNVMTFMGGIGTPFSQGLQGGSVYPSIVPWAYLLCNMVAVGLSVVCAVDDSLITVAADSKQTPKERQQFIERVRPLVFSCSIFYKLSLVGWLISLALLGYCGFNKPSTVPLWWAVGAAGFVLLCSACMYVLKRCVVGNADMNVEPGNSSGNCDGDDYDDGDVKVDEQVETLSEMSTQVLFLGGFAFNAVYIFNFQGRSMEGCYLHAMCASVSLSVVVLALTTEYNDAVNTVNQPNLRRRLAKALRPVCGAAVGVMGVVVVALLVGFACVGNIKHIEESVANKFEIVTMLSACLTAILIAALVADLFRARKQVLQHGRSPKNGRAQREDAGDESERSGTRVGRESSLFWRGRADAFDHERMEQQIRASGAISAFVASNVLYEVLQTSVGSLPFANHWYFAVNCVTVALSLVGTVHTIALTVMRRELGRDEQRSRFCHLVQHHVLAMFVCTTLSFVLWLAATMALGAVKFGGGKGDLWAPSFFVCLYGLAQLVHGFFGIKRRADEVLCGPATSINLDAIEATESSAEPKVADVTESNSLSGVVVDTRGGDEDCESEYEYEIGCVGDDHGVHDSIFCGWFDEVDRSA